MRKNNIVTLLGFLGFMVMAEGAKDTEDCPPMGPAKKQRLSEYMSQLNFEI